MIRLVVILALLAPATAAAADLDTALARMAASTGDAYSRARAEAMTAGVDALRARVRAAAWSAETWERDAMAAAALAWAERPDRCALVYQLRGLEPSVYLARRRPGPEVGRELRRLRDVGPVLYEALTRSLHDFSSKEDFPARLRPHADVLVAAERAALRVGLLAALGRTGHPIAPWALARVATDEAAPEGERRAAAIALGEVAALHDDAVPLLLGLASDATLSAWLRGGAAIGLGKATRADPRGLTALRALLADPTVRRAAVSALAVAGSPWAGASSDLRREISALLTGELRRHPGDPAIREALSVTR